MPDRPTDTRQAGPREVIVPEHLSHWTFLTNHTHVLMCVAEDPEIRVRDLAGRVGITERAAQRILSELVEEGYIDKKRVGRRNVYTVHRERPLRHPLQRDHTVGDLLEALRQPSMAGV